VANRFNPRSVTDLEDTAATRELVDIDGPHDPLRDVHAPTGLEAIVHNGVGLLVKQRHELLVLDALLPHAPGQRELLLQGQLRHIVIAVRVQAPRRRRASRRRPSPLGHATRRLPLRLLLACGPDMVEWQRRGGGTGTGGANRYWCSLTSRRAQDGEASCGLHSKTWVRSHVATCTPRHASERTRDPPPTAVRGSPAGQGGSARPCTRSMPQTSHNPFTSANGCLVTQGGPFLGAREPPMVSQSRAVIYVDVTRHHPTRG
jgi:hypothetical protein